MKELRVEYSLPKKLCSKTKVFQNVSLSFFATNLFCITNFPQFDPEVASLSGSSLYRGVETGSLPDDPVPTDSVSNSDSKTDAIMKMLKYILIPALLLTAASACMTKFEEYNTNPNEMEQWKISPAA